MSKKKKIFIGMITALIIVLVSLGAIIIYTSCEKEYRKAISKKEKNNLFSEGIVPNMQAVSRKIINYHYCPFSYDHIANQKNNEQ